MFLDNRFSTWSNINDLRGDTTQLANVFLGNSPQIPQVPGIPRATMEFLEKSKEVIYHSPKLYSRSAILWNSKGTLKRLRSCPIVIFGVTQEFLRSENLSYIKFLRLALGKLLLTGNNSNARYRQRG